MAWWIPLLVLWDWWQQRHQWMQWGAAAAAGLVVGAIGLLGAWWWPLNPIALGLAAWWRPQTEAQLRLVAVAALTQGLTWGWATGNPDVIATAALSATACLAAAVAASPLWVPLELGAVALLGVLTALGAGIGETILGAIGEPILTTAVHVSTGGVSEALSRTVTWLLVDIGGPLVRAGSWGTVTAAAWGAAAASQHIGGAGFARIFATMWWGRQSD